MTTAGSPNTDAANANVGSYTQQPEPQQKKKRAGLLPTLRPVAKNALSKKAAGNIANSNSAPPRQSISRGDQNPDLVHPVGAGVNGFPGRETHDVPALLNQIETLKLDVATLDKDLKTQTQHLARAREDLADEKRKKGPQDDLRLERDRLRDEVSAWRVRQENTQALLNSKDEEARVLSAKGQSLCEQINSLQGKLGLAQQELTGSRHQVEELNGKIEELQGSYNDIQVRFQIASDELNVVKNDLRVVCDDEFFRVRWGRLQRDIEQWAEDHFGGKLESSWFFDGPTKGPRLPQPIAALCTDAKEMLKDDDTRHLIIEAYLWKFIEDHFFDSEPEEHSIGMTWALRVREELSILERFLRPDPKASDEEWRKFMKWKANTSNMIISRNQQHHQIREEAFNPNVGAATSRYYVRADQMRIHFRRDYLLPQIDVFLQVINPWLTSGERECREDLFFIFRSVVELDAYIHEQWARFFAVAKPRHEKTTKRHDFPFDGHFMVCASPDHQMQRPDLVGLVLSPALVRAGTQNGDDYHSEVVIAGSRVLPCGFNPRDVQPKQQHRQWGWKSKDASQQRTLWG